MAKDVTKKEEAGLPAELMEDIYNQQGRGAENATNDDMTVPFIKCAQKLSDEVNKRESAYIEGLEEGDFFNTATQQMWKGEQGFGFVPVKYRRTYLEWVPRDQGGGFQGEHDESIMDKTTTDDKGGAYLSNGNEIVVTAMWYGLIVDLDSKEVVDQGVISLSKTQFKKSKQLMTKLKSVMLPKPNGEGKFNPPTFYNVVKATSVPEDNDQGSWMGWKFELAGTVFDLNNGKEVFSSAKDMLEMINSGMLKAAQPDETPTDNGGGAGPSEASAGEKDIDGDEIPF